tara:strand:- start:2328 stop:2747 length:420 start_codon:yes stop_codon:yes gene_type:complete
MQDNNNDFSFDEVLFNMIKNAIKAASIEMYQDTQEMFEESQELMEAQLEEIIQDVEEPKTLTIERMQEMVDDYKEMGTFAEVMDNIGYFKTPQDVVTLLTSPNKYRRQYMLWVELGRPTINDKMYEKFGQAVWSRETLE